ncbi:recombinase family protein [Bacteroides uniformis]|uniref:recombinase family protein n=1 Tax=Bacteroides uniformis TaxID=820 RepID=UPI001485B21E|nr:recombinase family protein [Bacteroides uniformis]MDC1837660.1 recombinase family protein [Bacteroides uniformis]MDC1862896.1 recombinase family protein [Bacteroides uniformis]MDC1869128.1 recombinase family protein [Bacteroides uniformis]
MKAAIYIRISTKKQNTDRQYEELKSYANSMGYTIVESYEDQISGFKDEEERHDLNRLKEDAKTEKFDIILFSELSRLSRKTTNILELISYFRDDCKKSLYFQKQNLNVTTDKSDLGSELQLNILATIGSYEIELSTERQMGGKIQKVKKQCWTHGSRPYGYNIDENKYLHINEEEATVIREIYAYYLNNMTSVQIAHLLNSRNIYAPATKNKKQNLWHPNSVCQILRAKRNIGIFEATYHEPDPKNKDKIRKRKNRKIVEEIKYTNKALAIVSDDIFYSANEKIDKNIKNKDTAKKNISLLKGLLTCGHCGSNFFYKKSGRDKDYSYVCYGSRYSFSIGKKKCINPITINAPKMDGLIIYMAKSRLLMRRLIENSDINIKSKEEQLQKNEEIILLQNLSIKKINEEFNQYIKKAIKYGIDDNITEKEHQRIKKQIRQIEGNIERIKKENYSLNKQIKILSKDKCITDEMYNGMQLNEMKELFEEYIEKIVLYNTTQWAIVNVCYFDGSNEFSFLRKSARANELLHYNTIIQSVISEKQYIMLLRDYYDTLEIGNRYYYYPYYSNINNDVIYDKEREVFIKFGTKKGKETTEYTISEFIKFIYPKTMKEVTAYEYYYPNQKNE